ncbi:MAG TPA: group III truncated hemoglobin [Vicinamibacterales bacterium]|jgi:hemoglobin
MASVARTDITSRDDIALLVDTFYDRIRQDGLLGPIFDDVAHVDWSAHLPKMYDFWESVLFGAATFKGNPLAVHRALASLTPLTSREFYRWVSLFHQTVDDLFDGPMAAIAKDRAARIAVTMHSHVATSAVFDGAAKFPHIEDDEKRRVV